MVFRGVKQAQIRSHFPMADDGSKRMLMGKKRFLSFMRATAGYTAKPKAAIAVLATGRPIAASRKRPLPTQSGRSPEAETGQKLPFDTGWLPT